MFAPHCDRTFTIGAGRKGCETTASVSPVPLFATLGKGIAKAISSVSLSVVVCDGHEFIRKAC
jgi:hypothetical protein